MHSCVHVVKNERAHPSWNYPSPMDSFRDNSEMRGVHRGEGGGGGGREGEGREGGGGLVHPAYVGGLAEFPGDSQDG